MKRLETLLRGVSTDEVSIAESDEDIDDVLHNSDHNSDSENEDINIDSNEEFFIGKDLETKWLKKKISS